MARAPSRPEREIRDVHAVPTQDRPDLADDARLIVVADHDHRSLERRLDADAVDQHEPRRRPLEHGAFDPVFAVARVQLHRDEARVVPRPAAARLDDLDAAVGCDRSAR